MNNFSLFLDYGAVVKIRMEYKDDLYNFCKLLVKLGCRCWHPLKIREVFI